MTEEEVHLVAEELAKIGGTSWYPGREGDTFLRIGSDRYRDRARVAIAALDRCRAGQRLSGAEGDTTRTSPDAATAWLDQDIHPGTTFVDRPPGDQRTLVRDREYPHFVGCPFGE